MSAVLGERRTCRVSASPAPRLSARYARATSASFSHLSYPKRTTEKEVQLETSPHSATSARWASSGPSLSSARRSLGHLCTASPTMPLPHASCRLTRLSSSAGDGICRSSLRNGSARVRPASAPLHVNISPASTEKRCKYVVGTMRHCGSIYEEMTKQLLATGRWSHVSVRQRSITKNLIIAETEKDLFDTNMHLLLGEKIPCERVIATRRVISRSYQGCARARGSKRRSAFGSRPQLSQGPRMPMGSGDDGEVRVVDFVENTRSITLKSAMVTALLKYHNYNWDTLGRYLPMSFKLMPCQPHRDERQALLATAKGDVQLPYQSQGLCLWIVKSSAGCHGDNIEIFGGDYRGILKLLKFIDSQRDSHAWIAQQYVDRPLLYHKRKFDIRCWALLLRSTYEIYVHEELVMRTSSVPYNRESATSKIPTDRLVHITNHCVQESSRTYSLYEESNELWRGHLDGLIRYKGAMRAAKLRSAKCTPVRSPRLEDPNGDSVPRSTHSSKNLTESPYPIREVSRGDNGSIPRTGRGHDEPATVTLENYIMPQIHYIVRDSLLAARSHVPEEPVVPPTHTFQVFGYDFLIDEDLKVWLLEINGAPGGPDRLKPVLMRDTIALAVAPHFPGTMNLKENRQNGYVRVYPDFRE